jgi:hypothetical protein
VSKSVAESNLPIPDIGLIAQGSVRGGSRYRCNAGLDVKGLDMAKPKKTVAKAKEFASEKGDFVVYPTHGVGRVIDIEAKEIAGRKLDLFVISFEQERMTRACRWRRRRFRSAQAFLAQDHGECAGDAEGPQAGSAAPCGTAAPRSTKPRSTRRSGVDRRSRARPAPQCRPARPVL